MQSHCMRLAPPIQAAAGNGGAAVPLAALGDHLNQTRPRQMVPLAAGLDHAGQQVLISVENLPGIWGKQR